MSEPRGGRHAAHAAHSPATRIRRAWHALPHERRLAAGAAFGLFVTLFFPWYQETVIPTGFGSAASRALPSASLTGWASFSFVEAAVLLVAAGVLVLLFVRAEGRAFHVPGGDGGVITAAGFWTSLLIVWRMFDKEGTAGHGQYVTTSGIEWGIFIALGVAVLLAYAGSRIRLAHEPEPPLPGEGRRPVAGPSGVAAAPAVAGAGAGVPVTAAPPRRRGRIPPPIASEDAPARRAPQGSRAGRTPQDSPARRAPEDPRVPPRQRRPRPPRAAPDRGLNFSELDEIKFDDPPEPTTIRRASDPDEPTTIRRASGDDDPLTTRLDRPE